MFFPRILNILPDCYKSDIYLSFIGNFSVAAGSFIGFILLTLAYLQQEKKHQQELQESERRKRDEFVERFIQLFENVRNKIQYGRLSGERALAEFHKNILIFLNEHTLNSENPDEVKKVLEKAIKGSSFTKGGSLNLYKRSLDNVINRIYEAKSIDLIPFLENILSDEEKAIIFYLYKFYFVKSPSFEFLIENDFLASLNSTMLANPKHIYWLK
ncbi:hypothetical protein GCM10027164_21190 [Algoriphagus taiwanensis]|uniref:Phage abortive infection protein n=2 Tax=Algoriphagus taiwanensis TaxID=1445656 RepID=A0ABQ6PXC1_9BACT|nr:hypothetical protein Ataiwa_08720 [Algoriphagus taiwanensis]